MHPDPPPPKKHLKCLISESLKVYDDLPECLEHHQHTASPSLHMLFPLSLKDSLITAMGAQTTSLIFYLLNSKV